MSAFCKSGVNQTLRPVVSGIVLMDLQNSTRLWNVVFPTTNLSWEPQCGWLTHLPTWHHTLSLQPGKLAAWWVQSMFIIFYILHINNISDVSVFKHLNLKNCGDFPGGAVVKNPPANAGDTGLSPGPGRSHMPWSS